MSIIEVAGLTKYYGAIVGVDDVSFCVEKGEIFGFLGPNGAGKTTTIRLLMQLARPDAGRIALFDQPEGQAKETIRNRIGYLPGEFRPYLNMTGHRFLTYLASYRTKPPSRRAYLMDRLQVSETTLRQPIKHLSHGNRQKLGILLALEHDPDLVILDEPTLGLDPLVQEAFYDVLLSLKASGTTIFFSSHVLSEVEKICDRVAIIRTGKMVIAASLEFLKQKRPRRLILELEPFDSVQPPDLPGARLLQSRDGRHTYLVEASIQPVLQALATLPVRDLVFPEPDLEDVFMAYYREEQG